MCFNMAMLVGEKMMVISIVATRTGCHEYMKKPIMEIATSEQSRRLLGRQVHQRAGV
jgi:hypothetical protein